MKKLLRPAGVKLVVGRSSTCARTQASAAVDRGYIAEPQLHGWRKKACEYIVDGLLIGVGGIGLAWGLRGTSI